MYISKRIFDFFKRRFPARNDTLIVLSLTAFLVFSWELRMLFYQIPAFLLSYTVWEILSIAAYMLMFALLETLAVTFVMILVALILPGVLFRNGFGYKASWFILVTAAISIHLQFVMSNQPKVNDLLLEAGAGFVVFLVLALMTSYIGLIRKIVLDVLDRLTIFSYIYLPLGVISMFVVIVRLLWP